MFSLKPFIKQLATMRMAVLLLGVLALASMAGTLMEQKQPTATYEAALGPFWTQVFGAIGLFDVFMAPWFLAVLVVLMVSLSTCLARNGPALFKQAFQVPQFSVARIQTFPMLKNADVSLIKPALIYQEGKTEITLYQQGVINRLGYFGVHAGLLLVLAAGLLSAFGWRAIVQLPEGASSNIAYTVNNGETLTERHLPFSITNQKFNIHYHPNGMPGQFTTQAIVAKNEAKIEVNQPAKVGAYNLYQASFGDAGSTVDLQILDVNTGTFSPLRTTVGQVAEKDGLTLEILEFRPHTPAPVLKTQAQNQPEVKDFGASVDYIITTPTASPLQLRSYQNHPNLIGVANQSDDFTPVFLGASMVNEKQWQALATFKQQPEGEKLARLKRAAEPYLVKLPETERYAAMLSLLQAVNVLAEFDIHALVKLEAGQAKFFTTLQVNYDPGALLFWPASLVLMFGIMAMAYAPYRRIWCLKTGTKTTFHIMANKGFWEMVK